MLIEGTCDETVDANGKAHCEIDDAKRCARNRAETRADEDYAIKKNTLQGLTETE